MTAGSAEARQVRPRRPLTVAAANHHLGPETGILHPPEGGDKATEPGMEVEGWAPTLEGDKSLQAERRNGG